MSDWYLAKSLEVLRDQVNALAPHRSKSEDGTKGDDAHAARTSDHNADPDGAVRAIDFTHDPNGGFDSYKFAETLRQARDERLKYVISNRKIFYGPRSPSHHDDPNSLWKWSSYNGENPHDKHVHVSVGDKNYYNKTDPWHLGAVPGEGPADTALPTLKFGSRGEDVKTVQQRLMVDGLYGHQTEAAVKEFQKSVNLPADGIVGLQTWAALLGEAAQTDGWQVGITATVFGGPSDPNKSAYTGKMLDGTSLYASLPARLPPGSRLLDIRGGNGDVATVPVEDVGPWLTDDPYWENGTRPIAEDTSTPLPRGPNKGRRSNGAGIDLSPAAAKLFDIDGKGLVDWRFHQDKPPTKEASVATLTNPTSITVPVESTANSKTNWTQYAGVAASALAIISSGKLNLTSEQLLGIVAAIQTLQGVVTFVLRTFFTGSVSPSVAAKIESAK